MKLSAFHKYEYFYMSSFPKAEHQEKVIFFYKNQWYLLHTYKATDFVFMLFKSRKMIASLDNCDV